MQSVISYIYYILIFQRFNLFETVREVWISDDFLEFINQISLEFWIWNTLLQKFLPTDMIFFHQFIVSTVKFGKCFAELMILTALLKELGG